MDLRLLGPLEAHFEGRPVDLGPRKQRAVLAMLALELGRTVSADRLVEGLWGDEPPASAPKMVQLYVSHLRRLLDGGGVRIVTRGRGYELQLSDGEVDAVRFERLLEQSQPREALALWRGGALADVADEPFAAAEIRRLDEMRLRATESAIDGDLAAGRHVEVLGELEGMVVAHPLREHLHAQHMLALYRSGRQSEALAAYRDARAELVEQIGVEPGSELRQLQDRILAHDPALDLHVADDVEPATSPRPPPSRGPARRRTLVAAAALLLAGVTAFGVIRVLEPDGLPGIDENAVGLIDPGSGRISRQFSVGRSPTALTVGGGSLWVLNAGDRSISRIDRARDQLVTIPVGDDPAGLAFATGSLWVTDRQDRTVSQISADSNRIVRTLPVANGPSGIAAGFGALWIVSEVDRTVSRIDLARGRPTKTINVGASPTAVATGAGAVWVVSEEGGTVFRINPRSGAVVKAIHVGNGPIGVAVGEGAVWVANRQDSTVSRIDPATNVATTVPSGKEPSAIAAGAGAVWVANRGEATVSRIDPAGRRPSKRIAVGGSPSAIAVSAGSVLITALAPPASHRGGTLRVESSPYGVQHVDPANSILAGNYFSDELASLAYDGLIAYRRAGGATYGTLVGDLAAGVPDPSADGRTYVFTLRPGIRYSDGEPVRAGDLRAAMESLLRRHGRDFLSYYGRIAGAATCVRRPRECDLSRGIVADEQSRTITIQLTKPDPDLLPELAFPLAYIVPAKHPFGGNTEPPGTGPYRIASFDPNRGARLVRNPRFHVWSQDARPDGFADEIVTHVGKHLQAQVASVRRGNADLLLVSDIFGDPLSAPEVTALAASAPGQLHTTAAPELDFMYMNVRRPPFDDLRVRRAINFAVDRRAIDESAGGPDVASSTCQIVPPGFPGYAPSCRYTADPGPAGGWNGPDFDRARRLIARSGTRGLKITVRGWETKRSILRYFVSLLRRLGYDSSLRVYPDFLTYTEAVSKAANGAQMGINGWAADFGAPSNFALPFRCDEIPVPNLSRLCDRRVEASIDATSSAGSAAPDDAWARVFRHIERAAPIVPLVNRREVSLVSKRVGNYQHHPMWGSLLDQMWVR
jgi:YVTN family beta-propeller protein